MKKLSVSITNDMWSKIYLLSSRRSISEVVRELLLIGLVSKNKATQRTEVKPKKPNDWVLFIVVVLFMYGLLSFAVDIITTIVRII